MSGRVMARSYVEDDLTTGVAAIAVPDGTDTDRIKVVATQYGMQAQRADETVNLTHSSGYSTISAAEYGIPLGDVDPTQLPVKGQIGLRISTDANYDP